MKSVKIYTDGACSGNPGPGGYGVILKYKDHIKELSQGYKKTTNNRMELRAIIAGLEQLKEKCSVVIYSDSKYIIDAVQKGWVLRWQKNGWSRDKNHKALNSDLWKKLLFLLAKHKVKFKWIRGHAGHPENERCDHLAVTAASANRLIEDIKF
jgi:ribonuclease HI